MDNFQIETVQNINIYQNVAGIGERVLAHLVDGVIMVCYIFILLLILGWSADVLSESGVFILFMTLGLPLFVYHLLWETFWDGRSPGKALMKLRVVKLDGSKPSFSSYLLRWLLRLVDISLTSGGLALVTILFNGKGQRLGDIAATTTVITEKKTIEMQHLLHVDIPEDYVPKYPQVTLFTDLEIQNIKSIFKEARSNGDHHIISKLADKLASVMQITFDEMPFEFLETIVSDYNFYTQNL